MRANFALLYAVSHFVAKRRKISNAQKLMFLPLAYFNRKI
ncbi:MAG TPA: hypothetical protein DHV15_01860 [Treponema sp.]|uniref:Uncharacterized protein n=1 Tax=Treponema denticola (strain ATCC 35405 / DSM 14222 / CIP 103919 / JCM 8153 / KCTC 15104) TaxID=243275 RepID=Q73JW6_TREDE|nr:hypothetical protein TDE_2521 [Treponema denticola ATCC 35405]HCY94248.1 hypothetical protein [Treponema sp.]